jgi:hypothetical protein
VCGALFSRIGTSLCAAYLLVNADKRVAGAEEKIATLSTGNIDMGHETFNALLAKLEALGADVTVSPKRKTEGSDAPAAWYGNVFHGSGGMVA